MLIPGVNGSDAMVAKGEKMGPIKFTGSYGSMILQINPQQKHSVFVVSKSMSTKPTFILFFIHPNQTE